MKLSESFGNIKCTYDKLPPSISLSLLACETERRLELASMPIPSIKIIERPANNVNFVSKFSTVDMIGFSTWFSNTEMAIRIAQEAKEVNPEIKIVFGGPDASNLGSRILMRREYVDYVVVGDGEDSLWRLICGYPCDAIPNLWYRDVQQNVKYSFSKDIELDDVGVFDFRHVVDLDLSEYDSRIQTYRYKPARLPISINWTRGCIKALSSNRCAYCSIPDKSFRLMSPKKAWAQIRHLNAVYGIESFFEGGDDFAIGDYTERLSKHEMRLQNIHLRSYCGLWGITREKMKVLKELGVSEIFLGLESTDTVVNRWSGHRITPSLIHQTLSLLLEYGIYVCIPFIFGLPGESRMSLDTGERLAYELIESFPNIRMVLVSLGVPLIGTRWFEELARDSFVQTNYPDNLDTIDIPDYSLLAELSIKRRCSVSLVEILATIDRIRGRLAGKVAIGCFGALDKSLTTSIPGLFP